MWLVCLSSQFRHLNCAEFQCKGGIQISHPLPLSLHELLRESFTFTWLYMDMHRNIISDIWMNERMEGPVYERMEGQEEKWVRVRN